jgi:hypothetical protein
VAAQLVDLHDVGVVQLDADPRLVEEHREELGVLDHRRQDALDGEMGRAGILERLGEKHLGHSADIDSVEQQVFAEGNRLLQ